MRLRRVFAVAAVVICGALAPTAHGGIAFQTGIVQGQILSTTGSAVPLTSVRATAQSGAGQITAQADASGAYSLSLPVDTYRVEALYQNNAFASATVTIVAQQTVTQSFTFSGGTLQTMFTRDGAAVAGSRSPSTRRKSGPPTASSSK